MTQNLIELVGNTPLIEIPFYKKSNVKISAKLEWYNPSGSVKDRAAAAIILDAIANKKLENKILVNYFF